MFLGTTFFCGKHTFLPPATNVNNFETLSISNGKFDQLYMSANPEENLDSINDGWKYETKLNASFEKDLEAGSIGFSTRNTDTVVIQTREKDAFDWKTIYVKEISKNEDFNFIEYYPFSRNLSTNEYKLISMINGIENSYVQTEEKTSFSGMFIVDAKNVYGTIVNLESTDTTHNITMTTLELLNSKFPSVYSNSESNYVTGSTSGCFLKFNTDTCEFDFDGGVMYRHEIMQWLTNKKSKILKLEDGRIYLIKVIGQPTDTEDGHRYIRRFTFDWVEIGDVNNVRTLYNNKLSDVGIAYW